MAAATHPVVCEVAVVGGGFAGSLLARLLALSGRDVLLLERETRPRMALGESTTPLANLALERLGEEFGQRDLVELATWGSWRRTHPELRCGKKRGFTFYGHQPGEPYTPGEDNSHRLLVAASPDDQLADTQWWRADLDALFLERARQAGVRVLAGVAVSAVARTGSGFSIGWQNETSGTASLARASFLIDATGGPRLRETLGVPAGPAPSFATMLIDTHVEALPRFTDLVPELAGAAAPYEEEWAAVHHLTAHGWMYQLRFDDGRASVGFVLPRALATAAPAARQWASLLRHYPTLERQLTGAATLRPLVLRGPLQHRAGNAAGERFVLLPHAFAFYSPLFSTGIAWALLAIERLLPLFAGGVPAAPELVAYDRGLAAEADLMNDLLAGAYALLFDLPAFAAYAMLYFALVSADELEQRLFPERTRQGFLAATDPARRSLVAALSRRAQRLGARLREADAAERTALRAEFSAVVRSQIEPFNLIGLADPARRNLYPVDTATLRGNAAKLGANPQAVASRLWRLRGGLAAADGEGAGR